MKLVELKCKNCGATLKVEENSANVNCQYCSAHFKLDDEVQHIQYDNMEQSGYDFEKGRIRAQREHNMNNQSLSSNTNVEEKKHSWIFYLFCLVFLPFVATFYIIKSKSLSRNVKIGLLVILWIFVFVVCAQSEKSEKELEESRWLTECSDISDFDYYLDGEQVVLKDHKTSDKRIKICSTYEIDGKEYTITKFSEGVFALDNVYSVILPDTLKSMPSNTFNSCNIKYVYIPASLEYIEKGTPFYSYFHDVEAIYYGGTEEQWKKLTNDVDREKIDTKIIEFNVDLDDLK